MAALDHNRFFKKPQPFQSRPTRSPSPPRRYVEPISPSRPTPIEPRYINYPPINDQVNYTVRPETAFAATPRSRQNSNTNKRGHQRTSSTIDTLAEAALVVSPSMNVHTQAAVPYGHPHAHPYLPTHGGSEPPHKRARSELLPSSLVAQYASRPATSYDPTNGRHPSIAAPLQTGDNYDSRVEEAALLLNFRTGGLSGSDTASLSRAHQNVTSQNPFRPHANSFPQDTYHVRPTECATHTALLPPFDPQDTNQPQALQSAPQLIIHNTNPGVTTPFHDSNKASRTVPTPSRTEIGRVDIQLEDIPLPTQISSADPDLRALGVDTTASEASEAASRSKRGWPKGKSRAGRKPGSEKATKGRASRRKTPDSAKNHPIVTGNPIGVAKQGNLPGSERRKSFGSLRHELAVPTEGKECRAKSVPPAITMIVRPASPPKTARKPKQANPDTVCAGCATVRESANSHGELDEWVSCNGCQKWFHVDCAGFKNALEVRDVDKFFCGTCEHEHGKTTYVRKSSRAHASVDYAELQRGVLKTSEETTEHHYLQAIKDGSIYPFDKETFPRMPPELVTRDYLERSNAFAEPICIPAALNPRPWLARHEEETGQSETGRTVVDNTAAGWSNELEYDAILDDGQDKLDMVMPEDLTVQQVCNLVGPATSLEVIDVKTQGLHGKWDLKRWADFYDEEGEDKQIRNVISLEVSDSKLGRMLRRPKVVRDIDLQDEVWPQEETDKGKYPKVQFYCLMSVADSYTDFHIDFGGSSVYYHILRGKKTFFFIPPKPKYLKMYEEWNSSPQQSHTFLPYKTGECYRVDLDEGDTMLIPSGWIHAVWTPATSLVIGGNFLTRMSYKNQFRVYDIEQVNKTPLKFQYPFFRRLMWYTAIRYLKDDPLPSAVSQMFHDGLRFERSVPAWADYDGEVAANDPRPGARNARYYSQAELNGLPDLVQFIFRQVMIVMDKVEGHSQDYIKRTAAIVPKGYGEPLEIAKTFALWVAWKRGNEDPPAWAHPDAILPSKEEGPPRQLSARALREMERKEAIAAWRIAPDRQSTRIRNTAASPDAMAVGAVATPERIMDHDSPLQMPATASHSPEYAGPQALSSPHPMTLMMNGLPGPHLSTPKTSVLGPKRVACDNCRKRRIKCKHKDMVTQVTPSQLPPSLTSDASYHSQPEPDFYDNIIVSPLKAGQAIANGHDLDVQNGNFQSPYPGTNAYVTANIPMAMNGVPMFGEAPKRGRSKACFECRRSKRRCVHDENGNVDPVKAAENPVPRGSVASKKRPLEDGILWQPKEESKMESDLEAHASTPTFPHHQRPALNGSSQQHEQPTTPGSHSQPAERPVSASINTQHESQQSSQPQHLYHDQAQTQPQIDPNLFSAYPEPSGNAVYANGNYPYPNQSHLIPYHLQSLEQIANEVLDMNGHSHEDHQDNIYPPPQGEHDPSQNVHVYGVHDAEQTPNGSLPEEGARPDGSVDSAVSFPQTSSPDQKAQSLHLHPYDAPANGVFPQDARQPHEQSEQKLVLPASVGDDVSLRDAVVLTSVEPMPEEAQPMAAESGELTLSPAQRHVSNALPLYQPPAPPSASPEQSRRQPFLNGAKSSPSEKTGDTTTRRKRESFSDTTASKGFKKAKLSHCVADDKLGSKERIGLKSLDEAESLELAKLLQQDDLGLRKRSR